MKFTKMIAGAALSACIMMAGVANAADWKPTGPIKMQIGFGAGGSTDTMSRVLAKVMKEQTGWNIIAENKPGGGGIAMFTAISKMPATGQVIGVGVNMPILVNLVKRGDKLGFDLDSFDYLGTIAKAELALVASKDAPFDDLQGLVAHAKENGSMAIAFSAPPQKLLMGVVSRVSKAKLNMVTTKGGAENMKLILGGQVLAGFGSGEQLPYLESGDMKVVASANNARLSYAKEAKTFVESGFNGYVEPYFFLATPKGTPPEALKALTEAIDSALKSDEMVKIVGNAIKGAPLNLGSKGTKDMLVNGIDNVKILFAK